MKTRIANIAAWDNGGGLSKDIEVLTTTLHALGWETRHFGNPINNAERSLVKAGFTRTARRVRRVGVCRRLLGPPFDLNFHLEVVYPAHLPYARRNVLIPNQDWFREASRAYFADFDAVFAKTHYAEGLFSSTGPRTAYVGWLSTDKYDPSRPEPRALRALHVAGSSSEKGTELVLDTWVDHPEWPLLTVVRSARRYSGERLNWKARSHVENIRIIEEKLSESALGSLQNQCLLHICPSEAEGYGHAIVEALSVGAVVVTTDGPPMNELVTCERGVLIPIERSEQMGLGRRCIVSQLAFEEVIEQVLRMPSSVLSELSLNARAWFEHNAASFPVRLAESIRDVIRQE